MTSPGVFALLFSKAFNEGFRIYYNYGLSKRCNSRIIDQEFSQLALYFYIDLEPMIHYVPASLENITEVTEYIMEKNNQREMKAIVEAANLWCKETNTQEHLPKDAIA